MNIYGAKGDDGESVPFDITHAKTPPAAIMMNSKPIPNDGVLVADIVVHYQLEKSMHFLPGDRFVLSSSTGQMFLVDPDGYVKDSTNVEVSRTMLPEK